MKQGFQPSQLENRDSDRMRGYRNLLDFYHGRHWEDRLRRGEKQLTFNYAKVVVDKITSYLMAGVSCVVEAEQDSAKAIARARKADQTLRRVYEENRLRQLDFETEIDCAILGDACFKVTWDTETKSVRVTTPDIQGVYAWWRGDDTSKLWRVACRYHLDAEEAEALYGASPSGDTTEVVEVWTDDCFDLWLNKAQIDSKPNPYGFIPFVIYPNIKEPKRFWGISDLKQLEEPQRELNRAVSQLSRILELSGNPIAVLENVEGSEDIAIRPGAVWNIPEDAKAYLLDLLQGGAVGLHIDYINLLYRIMHDVAESPRAAFGGTDRDLSGVALELELQPLLQKLERKRLIRSDAYNRRNRMILSLFERYGGGVTGLGRCHLRTRWQPVLPQDLTRLVANEQTLVQNGIHSRRHAMTELGVKDPEAEFAQWLKERTQILEMNSDISSNTHNSKTRRGRARAREEGPQAN